MSMLDVVVRFHDMRQRDELDRCIFSLVTQDYSPLTVHLVTQRFSDDERESLRRSLDPLLRMGPGVTLAIRNFDAAEPQDARAALINLGIAGSSGRYLAFLDYDDTVYPQAYRQLIGRLQDGPAAIAFGTLAVKTRDVFDDLLLVRTRRLPFHGRSVVDLFRQNFCPISSYVIDRARVDAGDLCFDAALAKLEDYDFLIRFCAKYPANFDLIGTVVGDYYVKSDGSNTTLTRFHQPDSAVADWERARRVVGQLKQVTMISEEVQRGLGRRYDPLLSVARLAGLGPDRDRT